MRPPGAERAVGVKDMELVLGRCGVWGDASEQPVASVATGERWTNRSDVVSQRARQLPLVREGDSAIQIDAPALRRLGKHVEVAIPLEDERIGEVVREFERDPRRTEPTVRHLGDADAS